MKEPFEQVQIAVAYVTNRAGEIAVTWNEKWGAFVLPMTKVRSGPPAETSEHAALRAAAEVFLLPVRRIAGREFEEKAGLQLSLRSGETKDYHYTVIPVEIHPDFAAASFAHRPVIFAAPGKLQDEEYQPLSPSVKRILDECLKCGWIPPLEFNNPKKKEA